MFKLSNRLLASCVLLTAMGCQSSGSNETDLLFTQTPPAVQAAFTKTYNGAVIKQVARTTNGNQDYYTFTITGTDGKDQTVKMNEAGDEIDRH
jgi:hypothetical protein